MALLVIVHTLYLMTNFLIKENKYIIYIYIYIYLYTVLFKFFYLSLLFYEIEFTISKKKIHLPGGGKSALG